MEGIRSPRSQLAADIGEGKAEMKQLTPKQLRALSGISNNQLLEDICGSTQPLESLDTQK